MNCGCIGNYHEPNVDWLIAEIKNALAEWDKTEADWEEMKKWIQNYFANLDITADVNAKLDEMAKDGTLESIINDEIFSDLNNRVTQNASDIAAANTRIDNINKELDNGYAIIIGDSYAVGESSGGENTSWASLLKNYLIANKQFKDAVILRKNGAGFNVAGNSFLDLLSDYVTSPTYPLNEIKMIIVGTAGNDAWNLEGLENACNQFINYCRTTFPDAVLKTGFIGWTYDTSLWASFKTTLEIISNQFSIVGSMLFGVESIMHYYPYFASGDYFSGTVAGCSKIMELASGEISVHREDKSEFSLFGLLGLFIMFSILFFIILGRGNGDDKGGNNGGHGGPADDILKGIIIGSMLGGGRDRNGWGGHSGGYGGGDFGGFGGFGGGDFGGGGASGRW